MITMEYAPGVWAPSQRPYGEGNGEVWNVTDKMYKSGMATSWNKFCFTGEGEKRGRGLGPPRRAAGRAGVPSVMLGAGEGRRRSSVEP